MAKRCRSRVPASTTFGYNGGGCSLFLNNRYLDSSTGTFLSVDPLVALTGDPYLYAAGNPTTYSDPTGLEKGANGEAQASCRYNTSQSYCYFTGGTRPGADADWLSEFEKPVRRAQAEARGRELYTFMFGSVVGTEAHHNWPIFMGGPKKQTLTDLEGPTHKAAHDYIARRIEEDFGFKPRGPGKSGRVVQSEIDRHAKTNDPETERQEWMRDVINEDGFAEAVGEEEAGEVRDNFDHDFPKFEYSSDGFECACAGWYPADQLPPGYRPVTPGVPIVPTAPLGPMPAMPGLPEYVPVPALA